MSFKRYLFLDRDGTLLQEPSDFQVDAIEKFNLMPDLIPSLIRLKDAGFQFVMVSNQDGLGTANYPQNVFDEMQNLLLGMLETQGIVFESVRICPHFENDRCMCRKPQLKLVQDYLASSSWDRSNSYMIGDRSTDLELAENMGLNGFLLSKEKGWKQITQDILCKERKASVVRKTKETDVCISVNLDSTDSISVNTRLPFFDHMLEQLCKHGGFAASIEVHGDLHIDEHHTVEDTAIALGTALRSALGNKWGIERYGFYLPLDEATSQVALDLSGRAFFRFEGQFSRESINGFATEMVPHFFKSFSDALQASLHIRMQGDNCHHQIESMFKAVARALRSAIRNTGTSIPSTKGVL